MTSVAFLVRGKFMKIIGVLFCLLAACGPQSANSCATRSATYIEHLTVTSGNCGVIPDVLVNISADGTIPQAADVTCEAQDPDGCTQRNTNCRGPAVNGVTCSVSSSITFESNGAGASGVATIGCTSTTSAGRCDGRYSVVVTRQ